MLLLEQGNTEIDEFLNRALEFRDAQWEVRFRRVYDPQLLCGSGRTMSFVMLYIMYCFIRDIVRLQTISDVANQYSANTNNTKLDQHTANYSLYGPRCTEGTVADSRMLMLATLCVYCVLGVVAVSMKCYIVSSRRSSYRIICAVLLTAAAAVGVMAHVWAQAPQYLCDSGLMEVVGFDADQLERQVEILRSAHLCSTTYSESRSQNCQNVLWVIKSYEFSQLVSYR